MTCHGRLSAGPTGILRMPPEVNAASPDPAGEFRPSAELVGLVMQHTVAPDEHSLEALKERSEHAPLGMVTGDPACRLGDRIEGLFANLALRAVFDRQSSVLISNGARLTQYLCNELVFRLRIDAYDLRPVFECLYHELRRFVTTVPRERAWGRIVADGESIRLEIDPKKALATPDPDDVDPEHWVAT